MYENSVELSTMENIPLPNTSVLEKPFQKRKWTTISDIVMVQCILEALGDDDKNKILSTTNEPHAIPEILDACGLPNTSGYRKIKSLINGGMLVACGHTINGGKKVDKYISAFENIRIRIIKNRITIKVQFAENYLNDLYFKSSNIVQKNPDSRQFISYFETACEFSK